MRYNSGDSRSLKLFFVMFHELNHMASEIKISTTFSSCFFLFVCFFSFKFTAQMCALQVSAFNQYFNKHFVRIFAVLSEVLFSNFCIFNFSRNDAGLLSRDLKSSSLQNTKLFLLRTSFVSRVCLIYMSSLEFGVKSVVCTTSWFFTAVGRKRMEYNMTKVSTMMMMMMPFNGSRERQTSCLTCVT